MKKPSKAGDSSLLTVRIRKADGNSEAKLIRRPRRFSKTWLLTSLLGEKLNTSRRYASNKKVWVNFPESEFLSKYGYLLANIVFCDRRYVFVTLSSDYFYCFVEKEPLDLFSTIHRVSLDNVCFYQNSHLLTFNYNPSTKSIDFSKYIRNRRCHRWNFAQFEEINLGLLTHFFRNEMKTFENPFLSFGSNLLFTFDSNKYFEKRKFSNKSMTDIELFSFLRKLYYTLNNEDQGLVLNRLVNDSDTSLLDVIMKYLISLETAFNTAQTYSQSEYEDDRKTINTENLYTTRHVRKKSIEVFDSFDSESLLFSQAELMKKFRAIQYVKERLLGSLCPKTGKIIHSSSLVVKFYFHIENQAMQDISVDILDTDMSCLKEEASNNCYFGVFYDLIEEDRNIKRYLTHVEGYREHRQLDIELFKTHVETLGFSSEEVEELVDCLRVGIYIRNIRIKKLNEANYFIKSSKALKKAAKLLHISEDDIKEFISTEITSASDVDEFLEAFFIFVYKCVVYTVFSRTKVTAESLRCLEVLDFKGLFEHNLLKVSEDDSNEYGREVLSNMYRFEELNRERAFAISELKASSGSLQDDTVLFDYLKLRVSENVIKHTYLDYSYMKELRNHLIMDKSESFSLKHFNSYGLKTLKPEECLIKYNIEADLSFTKKAMRFFDSHRKKSCLKVLDLGEFSFELNRNVEYKSILTLNSNFDLPKQFALYGIEKLIALHSLNSFPIVRSLFYVIDTFFLFGLVSREVHMAYVPLYQQLRQQSKTNFNTNIVLNFVRAVLSDILGDNTENKLWVIKTEVILKTRKPVVYLKHNTSQMLLNLRAAVRESAVLKIQHKFSFVFKKQNSILKIQKFARDIVLKPHRQYREASKIVSLYYSYVIRKDVKVILKAVRTIQSFARMILVQYSYKNQLNKISVIVKVQALYRRYRVKKKFDVVKSISVTKHAVLRMNEFVLFTSAVVDIHGLNTLYELILTSSKRLLIIDLKSNLINLEVENLHLGKNVIIERDSQFKLDCLVIHGKYHYYDILNKSYKTLYSRMKSNLNFSACLQMDYKQLLDLFNHSFMYSSVCKKKNRHRTKGLIKSKNKLIIVYHSRVYWLNLKLFQLERKSKQNQFLLSDDFSFSFETSTISNDSFNETKQNTSLVQLLNSNLLLKSLSITVDIKLRMDTESTIELQNVLTMNKKVDYLRFRTYSVKDRNIYKRFILLSINLQKKAFIQDRANIKSVEKLVKKSLLLFIPRNELSQRVYATLQSIREAKPSRRYSDKVHGLYYHISSEDYVEDHTPISCSSSKRYKKHIRRMRRRLVRSRYRNNIYLQYIKNKHKIKKSQQKDVEAMEEGSKVDERLKKILLDMRKKGLIDKFKLFGIMTLDQARELEVSDFSSKLGLHNKVEVEELIDAFRGFDESTGETAVEKLKLALLNVKLSKYLNNFTTNKFGSIAKVLTMSNDAIKAKFSIKEDTEVAQIRQVFQHYASFKPKMRITKRSRDSLKWPEKKMYACPECKKQYSTEFETCIQCGYFNNDEFSNRKVTNKLWCCKKCRRWNRLTSTLCENVFCGRKKPEDDIIVTKVSEWYSMKSNMRFFDKESSMFQFELVKEVDENARIRRKMYSEGDFVRYVNLDGLLKSEGVFFSAFGFIAEVFKESSEYRIVFEKGSDETNIDQTVEVVVPHRDIELVADDMLPSD